MPELLGILNKQEYFWGDGENRIRLKNFNITLRIF